MILRCLARLFHIDWPARWTADPDDMVTWLDDVIERERAAERARAVRIHTRQEDTASGAPPAKRISDCMCISRPDPLGNTIGDVFTDARHSGWPAR